MASQFLKVSEIKPHSFTQYSDTIAALQTALRADIPELGNTFEVLKTTAAPTVAILIVAPNQVLYVNPGQWVGYNLGTWEVRDDADMDGEVYSPYTP